MRLCVRVGFAVLVSAFVMLGRPAPGTALQEPSQAPPKPTVSPAAAEKEEAAKDADFKEPTGSEKARQEEIKKKACPATDQGYSAETDEKQHPTPEPEAGKALVYVLRPTMMGNKIQSKLAMNGSWVGVNRGHNYFFLMVDPGEHYFCSKAENTSALALKAEAGKTYFLEQKIKMGVMKARNQLAQLGDIEGKAKLAKCRLSTWQEKK
jgi:hypothetical protein